MNIDLLQVWLNLQCVGIKNGDLYRVNGSTCDDVELLLITKSGDFFYRHDVPQEIRESIGNIERKQDTYRIIHELDKYLKVGEIRLEMTYNFPERLSLDTPDVQFLGDTHETFDTMAIFVDGERVSRAWSIRKNDNAAEIAVETKEGHRRHGYGKQVVTAWVNYQLSIGKQAIYSHRSGNLESKALAESVGAVKFVELTSFMES